MNWVPRRFCQFRLRTLLVAAALLPAAIGGCVWWGNRPLRVWHDFLARGQAGDLVGINALCGSNVRIVDELEYRVSPRKSSVRCIPLHWFRALPAPIEETACPRTLGDVLLGRVSTRLGIDEDSGASWHFDTTLSGVVLAQN